MSADAKEIQTTATRRYRGQPVSELRNERGQRLREAAIHLIGREGYANVPIDRLCGEAHIATRHFYEHFSSREQMLAALADEFVDQALAVISETALENPQNDPVTTAIETACAFARYCMNHPDHARLALIETVGVSRAMEQHRRQIIHRFAERVETIALGLVSSGILREGDYRMTAIALVGGTNELMVEWLSGATEQSAGQMERHVASFFRALLTGGRMLE